MRLGNNDTQTMNQMLTDCKNAPRKPLVAVVGSGNVAVHLQRMLDPHAHVVAVNPRTLEGWNPDADIALIAVSDMAIAEVAQRLRPFDGIMAHTSGSVPMSALSEAGVSRPGVFYPLQTFSKARTPDYYSIPFFVEASSPEDLEELRHLAQSVSATVHCADSEARRKLHLASVLACNFTNHLVELAEESLAGTGIDRHALLPLLHETVAKLDTLTPHQAQTGPAVRGDSSTVNRHLDMLRDFPALREIYSLMSESIILHHQEKTM